MTERGGRLSSQGLGVNLTDERAGIEADCQYKSAAKTGFPDSRLLESIRSRTLGSACLVAIAQCNEPLFAAMVERYDEF